MYDICVVGGGPAGLSAAVSARARDASVLVMANDLGTTSLAKAPRIDNYLGMPGISGEEMMSAFTAHARAAGAEIRDERVVSILKLGDSFVVTGGADAVEARSVILALGVVPARTFPGEKEYLGRGVSYCATCDGMLYRGKRVAVVGWSAKAAEEADFLSGIGCDVTFVEPGRPGKGTKGAGSAGSASALEISVEGDGNRATSLVVGEARHEVECVFILRDAIAPATLVDGLEVKGAHIAVDDQMQTNIPGVFAAGDCIGGQKQVAKAVGDGLVAGLGACKYVAKGAKLAKGAASLA